MQGNYRIKCYYYKTAKQDDETALLMTEPIYKVRPSGVDYMISFMQNYFHRLISLTLLYGHIYKYCGVMTVVHISCFIVLVLKCNFKLWHWSVARRITKLLSDHTVYRTAYWARQQFGKSYK